ncbi:hypothetical protein WG936_08225 [Corynebacterium sp. H127]|uniref:hypothetical protein n=1 Tax=Corynebacterium sp. H127 TaxID=3133418 RepID=UPI0030A5480B
MDPREREGKGYKVTYTSPFHGEVWTLSTPIQHEREGQRLFLVEDGFKGGVGSVNFSMKNTVNRLGERVGGWNLPSFDGSFDVCILDKPESVANNLRNWRRGWSQFHDGIIQVIATDGAGYWCNARLDSFGDIPRDPQGTQPLLDSINWVCHDGCWFGETKEYAGSAVVKPAGDVEASARIAWDGQATTLRNPYGESISLPNVGSQRYLDVNRGMYGHITFPDGTTDLSTWRALRASLAGITMEPGKEYGWNFGAGLTLEVTDRWLSPWG